MCRHCNAQYINTLQPLSPFKHSVELPYSKEYGATENAGVENAIRAKIARVENAGVEKAGVDSRGGKCRSKSYGTPTRDYIEKTSSYFVGLVLILLTE